MPNYYSQNADKLTEQYNSLSFEQVHGDWLEQLPAKPGLVLDVGAGSGRDARALTLRGWTVYAVEPNNEMRELAEAKELSDELLEQLAGIEINPVHWLADQLPELTQVRSLGLKFDVILLSVVWMHIAPDKRERTLRILSDLLAPMGKLIITLRHGPDQAGRNFYPSHVDALKHNARDRALSLLHESDSSDKLARSEVSWQTLVFQLPDDGTGALPLLRHIIVNDNKSASYKLGLLRVLTQLADGLPGIALAMDDDWVVLPFGVVGLYWLKQYQPLISGHQLLQTPTDRGYGFVKDAYNALSDQSVYQFAVGRQFSQDGATVLRAIRDACLTIKEMPAKRITWPGTSDSVFETNYQSPGRLPKSAQLDKDTLAKFGHFMVPRHIWDCMSQYAVWIEPAIRREWIKKMAEWNPGQSLGLLDHALDWPEAVRDTSLVRKIIERMSREGEDLNCVWSGRRIEPRATEIDHCFPWAHWQNNDLWNLMPARHTVNQNKSDKLPSAITLEQSRQRILHWWDQAYFQDNLKEQFQISASAALPGLDSVNPNLESIFQSLRIQRDRIHRNQQLPEWVCG